MGAPSPSTTGQQPHNSFCLQRGHMGIDGSDDALPVAVNIMVDQLTTWGHPPPKTKTSPSQPFSARIIRKHGESSWRESGAQHPPKVGFCSTQRAKELFRICFQCQRSQIFQMRENDRHQKKINMTCSTAQKYVPSVEGATYFLVSAQLG
jgi:hypothetical protein